MDTHTTDRQQGNSPRASYGSQSQLRPRPEHAEGRLARSIEQPTAQLPSDTFLGATRGARAVSAALPLMGKQKTSLFIGQWAPSFLLLGVYNKIVKGAGSQ
jgi:hypothetical protein